MSSRPTFTHQDSLRGAEPESEKRESLEMGDIDHKHEDEYAQAFADDKNIPLADSESKSGLVPKTSEARASR